jgi:hypothetical protein
MTYKVVIDMTIVLPKIKYLTKVKLGMFNNDSVSIEIEAKDPDDACYLAFKTFCDYILEQSSTNETKNLLRELKNDFIVLSLRKI